jgi:hemerythrin
MMGDDDARRLAEAKAQTIDALVEFCIWHFESEEGFMRSIGFPDLESHRKAHQAFVAKVLEYREELMTVYGVQGSQVIKLMTDWLGDHILIWDKKYAEFAGWRGAGLNSRSGGSDRRE